MRYKDDLVCFYNIIKDLVENMNNFSWYMLVIVYIGVMINWCVIFFYKNCVNDN